MRDFQQLIDGKTIAATSGEWLDSIDPSTGEVWARIPRSNGADVDAAVDAAARAFPGWWALPTLQRGAHLRAVAEVMDQHTRELAELETRDNGRIVNETLLGDLPACVQMFFFFAGAADKIHGDTVQLSPASFNFTRRGVQTEYARRLSDQLTVTGRYAIDTTRLFDQKIPIEDRVNVDRFFPQARLSTFTGSVLRDSRDDVLDPTRGTVTAVDAWLAARALGSEIGFVKSYAQAFWYRQLPRKRVTLVTGVRVGLAEGFERLATQVDADGQPILDPGGQPVQVLIDDVPARERFFAGGDTTVRGFVLDRLGTCSNAPVCDPATDTLSDQGFPTGGNGLVLLNAELRTAYWKGLSGVGFVDVGNVFRRVNQIELQELRPAVGFGVRFRSPIGPVRADLGFNLNRRLLPGTEPASQERERGLVFHISLGQAF